MVASYGFSPLGGFLAQHSTTGTVNQALVFNVSTHTTTTISSGADDLGFSPGDHSLLVWANDGSATLHALPSMTSVWSQPANGSSSTTSTNAAFAFSPKGGYLEVKAVSTVSGSVDEHSMNLKIFNAASSTTVSTPVYQDSYVFGLPPQDDESGESSGFGPDDAVFVDAYADTADTSSTLVVRNLAAGITAYSATVPNGAAWSLSPCDDVFALSIPVDAGHQNLTLYRTTANSSQVGSQVQIAAGAYTVTADTTSFTVKDSAGTTRTVGPNPSGGACVVLPDVASVSFDPATVPGGTTSAGTVTLTAAATADVAVGLTSDKAAVTVPASVTVPEGSTSATFTATTSPTGSAVDATVTADAGGRTAAGTLTVSPAEVQAITVVGDDESDPSVGYPVKVTVSLNGPAEAGGHVVQLSSAAPDVLSAPASVTVPAGADSVDVTLSPGPADSSTSEGTAVDVTATDVHTSVTTTINLLSPVVLAYHSFELNADKGDGDVVSASAATPFIINFGLDRDWDVELEGGTKDVLLHTDHPELVGLPTLPDGTPGSRGDLQPGLPVLRDVGAVPQDLGRPGGRSGAHHSHVVHRRPDHSDHTDRRPDGCRYALHGGRRCRLGRTDALHDARPRYHRDALRV